MKLKISKDLELPLDAMTQKIAFLGRTGSGKTYAASKLAEEMLRANGQIIIIDPVGVWWGLRLLEDGKSPGIPITIFGGLHGDVPLEPSGGRLVADIIVDRGISMILDVSQFESDADKTRFATDWADRFFFRKKSSPSAVFIAMEEAQEFMPQNTMKGEERMLHAFNRLWKLGRNFGIGGAIITQRPQEVNKKALNMTECIFAFQMTGPQERKAIEGWIAEKGLELDIAGDLPKLDIGTAHVWSPQWLRISETVAIDRKRTYNASSTPVVGQRAGERHLAPIDIEKLRTEMKATIERAKENDPAELKRRIRQLEADLKKAKPAHPAEDAKAIADRRAFDLRMMAFTKYIARQKSEIETFMRAVMKLKTSIVDDFPLDNYLKEQAKRPHISPPPGESLRRPEIRAYKRSSAQIPGDFGDRQKLPAGARRLLSALTQWAPNGMPEGQMRTHAGLKKNTGSYSNYKSSLRQLGLIEERGGLYFATQEGLDYVGHVPPAPASTDEVLAIWMPKLAAGAKRMLEALIRHAGNPISDEDLRIEAELSNSGSYSNYKSHLKTAGLIIVERGTVAANRENLFL